MRLSTEKELKWWEIHDKIYPYLNDKGQVKDNAPDWAKELYGEWKKRLQEMREEMIEEEKKNGSIEY